MSFIEMALDGVHETQPVPEDEYELQVEDVIEKRNEEKGRTSYMFILNVMNPPPAVRNPSPVFHYMALPKPDDEKKTSDMFMLNWKRMLYLFNVPYEGTGFDIMDFRGASGAAFLKEAIYEGRPKNELVLPTIPEEKDYQG